MRFTALFLLALRSVLVRAQGTTTSVVCRTTVARTSAANVPTSTTTVSGIKTAFRIACSTRTSTITARGITSTSTVTSATTTVVTQTPTTGTITSTSTVSASTVVTTTSTGSTTVTQTVSTTVTPTTTVPTPADFTPVASATDYVARKRSIPLIAKNLEARQANRGPERGPQRQAITGNQVVYTPQVYPVAVNCFKYSDTVSTRVIGVNCGTRNPTSTTTLQGPTFTVSVTTSPTVTSTVTVTGATVTETAVTTVVTTSTSTVSQFNTVTVTETNTAFAPTATVYAACGDDNLVSTANGGHFIAQIDYSAPGAETNNQVVTTTAGNPYDCCVACQQTLNCIFSNFYASGGGCSLAIGDQCDATQSFGTDYTTSEEVPEGFTVSNGPCGQVANGGDS